MLTEHEFLSFICKCLATHFFRVRNTLVSQESLPEVVPLSVCTWLTCTKVSREGQGAMARLEHTASSALLSSVNGLGTFPSANTCVSDSSGSTDRSGDYDDGSTAHYVANQRDRVQYKRAPKEVEWRGAIGAK